MAASSAVGAEAPLTLERRQSFARLVGEERDRMVAIAYHLVGGDRDAARDVAQEAFVKAFRGLATFRGEAGLRTWLTRIVVNEASRHRRRQAVRQRVAAISRVFWPAGREERAPAHELPDAEAQARHLRARIAKALDKLSAGQRAAFAMVHLEGMSIEQAAQVLGKAPGTIKSHLHRALVFLRRDLGDLEEAHHG